MKILLEVKIWRKIVIEIINGGKILDEDVDMILIEEINERKNRKSKVRFFYLSLSSIYMGRLAMG